MARGQLFRKSRKQFFQPLPPTGERSQRIETVAHRFAKPPHPPPPDAFHGKHRRGIVYQTGQRTRLILKRRYATPPQPPPLDIFQGRHFRVFRPTKRAGSIAPWGARWAQSYTWPVDIAHGSVRREGWHKVYREFRRKEWYTRRTAV